MGYRLGVDVGGTFTDLLLFNSDTGAFWRHKTPSTPHDSSEGILNGVTAICGQAGVATAEIDYFLHGTTVATNAVLEGKGARVGLIVTEGYRDIMQIARSYVPGGLAAWIIWPKPTPLAALEDTVTVGWTHECARRRSAAVGRGRCPRCADPVEGQGRRSHHRQLHECLHQWCARGARRRIGARDFSRRTHILEPRSAARNAGI